MAERSRSAALAALYAPNYASQAILSCGGLIRHPAEGEFHHLSLSGHACYLLRATHELATARFSAEYGIGKFVTAP